MTKKPKITISSVELGKLNPAFYNPREITPKELQDLCNSIEEFGFVEPIVANKDQTVIGGHQRLKAAKKLEYEEVPVIYVDLDKRKEKILNVALNKISGTFHVGMLIEMLEELDMTERALAGYDEEEYNNLINKLDTGDVKIEEDDLPSAPKEAKTKPGDVYKLGNHTLLCGDATSMDDIKKLMGDTKVDLVLTDPPYNVNYEGKTKDALKIENDKMDHDSFRQFLRDSFSTMDSVMKPGAVFYIWHADSEGYNFRGACHDVGWPVRQCLIWNKNTMVMGRQDYHWKHEPCLYGWKEGASHLWASDRKQVTILEFDRPTKNKEHPTMKPIKLLAYQIQNNTKGQDVVLDIFGGSGSTLVAFEQLGRICYTMELDPIYCDVIVDRWEKLTGNKATLVK